MGRGVAAASLLPLVALLLLSAARCCIAGDRSWLVTGATSKEEVTRRLNGAGLGLNNLQVRALGGEFFPWNKDRFHLSKWLEDWVFG